MPLDDPWASDRMAEYAYVRRAENDLHPAVQAAVKEFLDATSQALIGKAATATTIAAAFDVPLGLVFARAPDMDDFPGDNIWQRAMDNHIRPASRRLFDSAYYRIVGARESAQTTNRAAGQYLSGLGERLAGFRSAVWERLRRSVGAGREAGETPEQLRARVAELMVLEEWDGQVMTMTRTETMSSLNAGAYAGAFDEQERTGEPWQKRWQATDDQRVRHTHSSADGQIRPLHDPFDVGGAPLQFPGDPHGPAGEVINCRCAARYGPAADPSLTAATGVADFHGTPGRPSYRKYHPSGRNAAPQGLTRHPNGGTLGSGRFTEEQHSAALQRYTRSGYYDMNEGLRHGTYPERTKDALLERISTLSDLISIQEPTTKQTSLYRRMEDFRLDLNEGDEFHDRAFLSTSSDENIQPINSGDGDPNYTFFKITVPKGARILDVASVGGDAREKENILPPGTKMRVRKVVQQGDPTKPNIYELEVINA